ncbi:MAG: glycosyltransferase family 4 protein [Pseudomonadota bacterium]
MSENASLSAPAAPGARPDLAPEASAPATTAPLRILMTSYRSNPRSGGQGVFMRHITRALVELGHHVDVVSGPPYPDLDPRVRLVRLPSLDLYARENWGWGFLDARNGIDAYEYFAHLTGRLGEPYTFGERFRRWIRDHAEDYDVVHDNQTLSWGVLAAREHGLPVVGQMHHPITVDRDLALDAAKGFHWRKWGLRQLIRRWHGFLPMQMKVAALVDERVTITDATKRDFAREFRLDEKTITRVHLGVDLDIFRPTDVERSDDLLVCTASADVALKGLIHLIEAMGLLKETHPEARLTVVGALRDGPTKRRLEALDLGERVNFVSGISDEALVDLYNRAAVAVVPSLYEGFGLPAGEAMACGAPVVATDGGALPEVVGDAGRVVAAKDPRALAAAIGGLLDDPAERAVLAARGRNRVERLFNWRRCAEETVAVHRKAIAKRTGC